MTFLYALANVTLSKTMWFSLSILRKWKFLDSTWLCHGLNNYCLLSVISSSYACFWESTVRSCWNFTLCLVYKTKPFRLYLYTSRIKNISVRNNCSSRNSFSVHNVGCFSQAKPLTWFELPFSSNVIHFHESYCLCAKVGGTYSFHLLNHNETHQSSVYMREGIWLRVIAKGI